MFYSRWSSSSRIVRSLTEGWQGVAGVQKNAPLCRPHFPFPCTKVVPICRQTTTCTLLVVGLSGILFLTTYSVTIATASAAMTLGAMLLHTHRLRVRVKSEVDRDLPALIAFLASSVRAGLDPMVALVEAQNYLQPKTFLQLAVSSFSSRIQQGVSEETSIQKFCEDIQHPELPLLRACLLISRRHGTSIADPLYRINRVVRQRQSFRRKVKAALIMHKMSGVGIAGCAVLISIMQLFTNYSAVLLAVQHPVGRPILICGIILVFVGVGWMLSMGQGDDV